MDASQLIKEFARANIEASDSLESCFVPKKAREEDLPFLSLVSNIPSSPVKDTRGSRGDTCFLPLPSGGPAALQTELSTKEEEEGKSNVLAVGENSAKLVSKPKGDETSQPDPTELLEKKIKEPEPKGPKNTKGTKSPWKLEGPHTLQPYVASFDSFAESAPSGRERRHHNTIDTVTKVNEAKMVIEQRYQEKSAANAIQKEEGSTLRDRRRKMQFMALSGDMRGYIEATGKASNHRLRAVQSSRLPEDPWRVIPSLQSSTIRTKKSPESFLGSRRSQGSQNHVLLASSTHTTQVSGQEKNGRERPSEKPQREERQCEGCRSNLRKGARFCTACGKLIVRVCQSCGAPLSSTKSRVCGNCDTRSGASRSHIGRRKGNKLWQRTYRKRTFKFYLHQITDSYTVTIKATQKIKLAELVHNSAAKQHNRMVLTYWGHTGNIHRLLGIPPLSFFLKEKVEAVRRRANTLTDETEISSRLVTLMVLLLLEIIVRTLDTQESRAERLLAGEEWQQLATELKSQMMRGYDWIKKSYRLTKKSQIATKIEEPEKDTEESSANLTMDTGRCIEMLKEFNLIEKL